MSKCLCQQVIGQCPECQQSIANCYCDHKRPKIILTDEAEKFLNDMYQTKGYKNFLDALNKNKT